MRAAAIFPVLAYALSLNPAGSSQPVDSSTLKGKVLLGYQGWFRCPGGGTSGGNWSHWANGTPSAATTVIDMYPDLREFDRDELCAVPDMTIGAAPAYLFSAGNSKTVVRHFRWMQQYGLDGVLVQRFVTDIPGLRAAGDLVLRSIMTAAAQYGRAFAIEYDISGANASTVLNDLEQDWNYLLNTVKVTAHPNYLYENGRPVVSVWGIGLNDAKHPPTDPAAALQLITWLRSTAQVTYIGGTPAYWRNLSNDSWTDASWTGVYRAMDAIQPWTVGRYSDLGGVNRWRTSQLEPDIAATGANNQLYMPVIFPGFSWYNLNRTAPQNQIPRNRGEFLWRQAYNAKAAGAQMLKIAMFDEVNESTAMFKVAARRLDAPDQGYWLTLDADGFVLPSDWYLRLAGEISRIFHGQAPIDSVLPLNPGPPWPDSAGKTGLTIVSAASFREGSLAPESLATATGAGLAADSGQTEIAVIDSSGVARSAHLLYSAPTQVNFEVPAGTAAGRAAVVVASGDGVVTSGGVLIEAVAPAIFAANSDGKGVAAAIARLIHADGTQSAALVFACSGPGSCTTVPVELGAETDVAVLELYGTGVRGRSLLDSVSCTIGGVAAAVLYAGPQGQYPGVDQVNVVIPRSLARGVPVAIRLTVDGRDANEVTVTVR